MATSSTSALVKLDRTGAIADPCSVVTIAVELTASSPPWTVWAWCPSVYCRELNLKTILKALHHVTVSSA